MSAWFRGAAILFRSSLVRTMRTKRFLVLLLAAAAPPFAGLMVRLISGGTVDPEHLRIVGFATLVQVIVPAIALVAGTSALGEELEDGTIAYLVTRPLPRTALFAGKAAAAFFWAIVLTALAAVGLALTTGPGICAWWSLSLAAEPPVWCGYGMDEVLRGEASRAIALASLAGVAAYTAIFAALGVLTRRSMIVGVAYVFAIEVFLANLPGKTRVLTVQHHMRELLRYLASGDWGPQLGMRREADPDPGRALIVLGCIVATALAVGLWTCARRQFVRTSAE